ncbi:MAG: hypothetical protein FWC47_16430 [Oscillospiraceae bacterium]|nr:hypothetical protein [Oscillospiraceae bacterium]
MKRLIFIFVFLLFVIFSMIAYAQTEIPKSDTKVDNVLQDGNEKYSNMYYLYQHWEETGYPDYVGGVCSTDGGMDKLTVLLVDDDDNIKEQILSSLVDSSGVSFVKALYSYNAMKAVQDEIITKYLGKDDKFYGIGIGYTSIGGEVKGFGESGKELRVVVDVDESVKAEYTNKFHSLYGDMVVVE